MSTGKCYLLVVSLILLLFSCKKDEVFVKRAIAEVVIQGARLTSDTITLFKDTVYILNSNVVRNAKQVLFIEAGTLIKINNNIGIIINANGKIIATGSKQLPIIFTSNAAKGTQGERNSWNGITITGSTATSSGVLSYVRIEFAGALGSSGALSLNRVDVATTLNNIAISYSNIGPSVELAGGNCNLENIVSYASTSTDFLLTNGYAGGLQNILSYRHPMLCGNFSVAGLHIRGIGTFPSISNFTVIGPDLQLGTSFYYNAIPGNSSGTKVAALLVSNGAKFYIRNSVLMGFPKTAFYLDSRESGISLQTGESDFAYSLLHSNDTTSVCFVPTGLVPGVPPINSADFKSFVLRPAFYNRLILNSAEYKFTDPYNYDNNPNPLPQAGSILLTGANFEGPVFGNNFFKKVVYRGAFGSENWMQGWVNFIPLQTDYNN